MSTAGPVLLQTDAKRAHAATVDILKEALEQAEAGEIAEVVLISYAPNRGASVKASPTVNVNDQIAGLVMAQYAIVRSSEDLGAGS